MQRSFLAKDGIRGSIVCGASRVPPGATYEEEQEEAKAVERDFNEKALLRAEVSLSRTEAELLARALRRAVRRDLAGRTSGGMMQASLSKPCGWSRRLPRPWKGRPYLRL